MLQSIPSTKRIKSNLNQQFLNYLSTKALTDFFDSMKCTKNNKNFPLRRVKKRILQNFLGRLKIRLMESVNQVFQTKTLNISQRQALIKLIEKKDRDERLIKN